MRILLITQWFDPEPTFKGLLFAQQLQELGHEVQVLTGFPNYPGGTVYPGYRVRPLQREVLEGVPVLRVPLYPSHDGSGVRRALNYLSFAAAASVGTALVRRPDVAYVYHPPATAGVPAVLLKVLRGVPFVYDVQDLWPDTLAATGMVSHPWVLGAVGAWMRLVYRASASVVVLSPGFRRALLDRGVPDKKVEVIRNWADETQLQVPDRSADVATALGFAGRFTVVFAGTMGRAQSLGTVLDAAELLADEPEIRFLLVGGGVEAAALRAAAQERGLDNVTFLDRRPVAEIGEVLGLADAVLVHLKDDPLFAITIPSKTQAYLLSGRPVLMAVRGDAADLVRDAGAGIVIEPDRPEQLAAAVRRLHRMEPAEREALGAAGRRYYREHLSSTTGTRRFAEVLADAALSRPRFDAAKRAVDVAAAGAGLVVAGGAMAALALLVRRRLGSPVLFRQVRPGKDEQPFELVKFRTMTDRRDGDGRLLPDAERLTPFGARLRATSLDELPELWNVLRGEMSLVGPRPLLTRYSEHFTPRERLRLRVRPGITGWAQVNGRNLTRWDDRLEMDAWYVENRSVGLDARILLRTATGVLRRSGVVPDPEALMQNLDDERRAVTAAGKDPGCASDP